MGDYKRKRRSRRHHNKLSENESDDDDEDEDDDDDDIDDDEDDFEVDANGLIVDPETERKKELKRRRMLKRRENDQESEDDIEEEEDGDIDLFDDVGDEGKGYLNDPKLKGDGTQFVVLNDTAYYEQQKEKERIKAIQIEQQRQELERQRLHQQQLQMQHQAQQYALQQQQQQQQQAMNTYYNGMNNGLTAHQFGAANVNNAQFNGFNVQSNDVQIVQNVDANYYQSQQQQTQQQTQHDVITQMNHNQNVQYVQQPIAQNQSVPIVEEKKLKKKRSRKKKKQRQTKQQEPEIELNELELPKRSGKSLEEILTENEFSSKLQEISDLNALSLDDVTKKNKVRILKGLPYQLQQEIMTDNYTNKTPSILTEYFMQREKIKNTKEATTQNTAYYHPQHFERMRAKQARDRRISSYTSPKQKKRSLVRNGNGTKKTEPAYLRVASPEILEKMHFSKNTRSALTLDHIVTKQYKNKGRKSGFFGKRKKRKSVTPKEQKKTNESVKDVEMKEEETTNNKNKNEQKDESVIDDESKQNEENEEKKEEVQQKNVQQVEAMNVEQTENDKNENKEEHQMNLDEDVNNDKIEPQNNENLDENNDLKIQTEAEQNVNEDKEDNDDLNDNQNDDGMDDSNVILTNSQEF